MPAVSDPASAQARRRTGPARRMTREQVVDAALEVMSSQGLDSVSFRTVAMRLGVDPKALYTYVTDKNDLLAAMFDKATSTLEMPRPGDPRPPADQIVDLLLSLRQALIRNIELFRLARPLDVPGLDADAWERVVQVLYQLDLDSAVAVRMFQRLVQYTLGSALYAARRESQPRPPTALASATFDSERHASVLALSKEQPFIEDDAGFETTIRSILTQRVGEV